MRAGRRHGLWTPWQRPLVMPEEYLRLPLSAGALRLAAALCKFIDRELACYPSNRALLTLLPAGTTERTLQRAKAELEALGVLRQRERAERSGRQTSNVYLLMVPSWDTAAGDDRPTHRSGEGDTDVTLPPAKLSGEGDTHDGDEGDVRVTPEGDAGVTPGTSSEELLTRNRVRARADVHVAVGRFAKRWTERHGRLDDAPAEAEAEPLRPVISDRDCASLKRLINHAGLDVVLRAIDAYFDSRDPYYAELGHTLAVFVSSNTFNRLIAQGRGAAISMPDLDQPIPWGQPGGLIRKWNEQSPDDCRAITTEALSLDWLAAERHALAKHPDEVFWDRVLVQFQQSAYLRGKTRPTPQNPTPLAKTLDWLFSTGRGGIDNAALVHDGKYRDGVAV